MNLAIKVGADAQCCQLKESKIVVFIFMPNISDKIITDIKLLLMSDGFKARHRKSEKFFTRKRILGFPELVFLHINRLVLSLAVELEKFMCYFNISDGYSKQAFSKARQQFSHSAFTELNHVCAQGYYRDFPLAKFKGNYLLLAVDGSLCQMPETKESALHFGRWKNHLPTAGMPVGRCSVFFDVLNRVILDAVLAPHSVGERDLFEEHRANAFELLAEFAHPVIYLMDRGYPSFTLLSSIDEQGSHYVVRCTKSYRKEVSRFVAADIDQDTFRLAEADKSLKVRIVRILLDTGEYEYLLTNTDLSDEELSEVYFLRWGIETFYGSLKGTLQLENFSSRTVQGVPQDFHVSILVANLSNLLIHEAQEKHEQESKLKPKTKYQRKVNRNVAIGIFKHHILELLTRKDASPLLDSLIDKIKKHLVDVKPNRKFPRAKDKKSRRSYSLTTRKAM